MSDLEPGEVITLKGRQVRLDVCGTSDAPMLCRDLQRRVAVRNVATGRLSYIQEWRLLKARVTTW